MKLTKYLFYSCMAGTFALSVIATWLYVPAPPPEFQGAAAVICAAVIAFCTGVLCFGLGCKIQAREIEGRLIEELRAGRLHDGDRMLQELRDLWAGIPSAARSGVRLDPDEAEDGEEVKPLRRAYSGE